MLIKKKPVDIEQLAPLFIPLWNAALSGNGPDQRARDLDHNKMPEVPSERSAECCEEEPA